MKEVTNDELITHHSTVLPMGTTASMTVTSVVLILSVLQTSCVIFYS